jgi:predicted PurR-regulated permease PerM
MNSTFIVIIATFLGTLFLFAMVLIFIAILRLFNFIKDITDNINRHEDNFQDLSRDINYIHNKVNENREFSEKFINTDFK